MPLCSAITGIAWICHRQRDPCGRGQVPLRLENVAALLHTCAIQPNAATSICFWTLIR
jgi:hypothetical protein